MLHLVISASVSAMLPFGSFICKCLRSVDNKSERNECYVRIGELSLIVFDFTTGRPGSVVGFTEHAVLKVSWSDFLRHVLSK